MIILATLPPRGLQGRMRRGEFNPKTHFQILPSHVPYSSSVTPIGGILSADTATREAAINQSCSIMRRFLQGIKGMRQLPINSSTSAMMIHKITHGVDYNQWLKRLDTQLNYLTNQNSINFHKRVQPMNKKTVS